MAATVDPVTTRTPLANALLGVGVKGLLGQITAELRGVVTSARSHCSALVAGETATIRTPTAVEVLGQPPQIERTSVMLIGDAMGFCEAHYDGERQQNTGNLFVRLENLNSGKTRKKFISCDILRIG